MSGFGRETLVGALLLADNALSVLVNSEHTEVKFIANLLRAACVFGEKLLNEPSESENSEELSKNPEGNAEVLASEEKNPG